MFSHFRGAFSTFANPQHTFKGAIHEVISAVHLSGMNTLIITKSPDCNSEMHRFMEVLANNTGIESLRFAPGITLSDQTIDILANGLHQIKYLKHLSVDGTNLANRYGDENKGLIQLFKAAGHHRRIKHLEATTVPIPKEVRKDIPDEVAKKILETPIDSRPLSLGSLNALALIASTSEQLQYLTLKGFWLKSEYKIPFIKQLLASQKPCPMIELDNLTLKPTTLEQHLNDEIKNSKNQTIDPQSLMQMFCASKRTSFRG